MIYEKLAKRIPLGKPAVHEEDFIFGPLKSPPSSLTLKLERTTKKAYIKSWLRQIDQDAKVFFCLNELS